MDRATQRRSLSPVILLPLLFIASASLLIVSGLCTFAFMAWQGPPPPRDPFVGAPSPDDPDPGLDVWAEFERQRELAVV